MEILRELKRVLFNPQTGCQEEKALPSIAKTATPAVGMNVSLDFM